MMNSLAVRKSVDLFETITDDENAKIRRGLISELVACAWFLAREYDVFRNVSPHGDTDIVVRKDGRTIPVDVKSAKPDGNISPHRARQARQIANGVEILYVFRDGRCEWGRDIDPMYGSVGRIPKSQPELPEPLAAICIGCAKSFIPFCQMRRGHQRYCSYHCARRTREKGYRAKRKLRRANGIA
jgi:hypothetical protein